MSFSAHLMRAWVGLAAALSLTLVAPSPAHALTVSLKVSRTSASPTTPVTFSGTVPGAAAGTVVKLQRRLGSGPWSAVKTTAVSALGTYSVTKFAVSGVYSYRAKAGSGESAAFSPPTTVSGTYARNIAVPAAGAPFTVIGRLPQNVSRAVRTQFSADGSSWTDRGQATSSGGLASVRTYIGATRYVRLAAPATGSLATWVGPSERVVIGSDPVIKKILDDTNAYRARNGKPALRLHPALNTVAGGWAYQMHQSCQFLHNPDYTSGYPWGWRKAAENIAAGQNLLSLVTAWINSSGHRANLLGDYTHIGIGYYQGSQCYGRYWVQDFAKY